VGNLWRALPGLDAMPSR